MKQIMIMLAVRDAKNHGIYGIRSIIVDDSLRGFLNAFLEKIGYGLGVAVETIINTVISYFLK